MKYKINPNAWNAMFPVPSVVVDEHIRLAGVIQLKVLLCMLRHSNECYDENDISLALGLDKGEVFDAMQYWVQFGILSAFEGDDGVKLALPNIKLSEQSKTQENKIEALPVKLPLAPIEIPKPTPEQIAARVGESPELRVMYSEAQSRLGRTIGYADQSSLLMLHDQYGLPVEVIIMIIEYAVSQGKKSISYIAKIGRDWSEREIDTLEKAEERIRELTACNGLWVKFKEFTGIKTPKPTAKQTEYLLRWNIQLGYGIDMICLAYEEMANHTDKISFAYMDKIIENWHRNKLSTKRQVEQSAADYKQNKHMETQKSDKNKKAPASYDLSEFNKQISSVPVYKRNGV